MKMIDDILRRFNFVSISKNDYLIKEILAKSICNKKIYFWKFVCMPKINIDETLSFSIDWGDKRYDTLSLSLKKDLAIEKFWAQYGIETEIEYVFDDWEVLFLRDNQKYLEQSKLNKLQMREKLVELKGEIIKWVRKKTGNYYAKCVFFSDLISYNDFVKGMGFIGKIIEQDVKYKKILNNELRFLSEIYESKINEDKIISEANFRIVQYSTEGLLLLEKGFGNKIYLNSEYPTHATYDKLNYLVKLPSLFYCKDSEINNIS